MRTASACERARAVRCSWRASGRQRPRTESLPATPGPHPCPLPLRRARGTGVDQWPVASGQWSVVGVSAARGARGGRGQPLPRGRGTGFGPAARIARHVLPGCERAPAATEGRDSGPHPGPLPLWRARGKGALAVGGAVGVRAGSSGQRRPRLLFSPPFADFAHLCAFAVSPAPGCERVATPGSLLRQRRRRVPGWQRRA
jgi:hypothetical protein